MNLTTTLSLILLVALLSQSIVIFFLIKSFRNIIDELKSNILLSELKADPTVYQNDQRLEKVNGFSLTEKTLIFVSPNCSTCQVLYKHFSSSNSNLYFVLLDVFPEWNDSRVIVSPELFEKLNITTTPVQINFDDQKEIILKKVIYNESDVTVA